MILHKRKLFQFLLLGAGLNASFNAFSDPRLPSFPASLKQGQVVIQAGGYWSSQGQTQHINIQDLIGDQFVVTRGERNNGLLGLGYFLDGQENELYKIIYGINAFYLAKTAVTGAVVQENLFTNLSYHYYVTHYPVYAVVKSIIKTTSPNHALTIDLGIGPNFMRTNGFNETSLDGITIPDNIFSNRTNTTFTASIGAGIRFNQIFGKAPLECGYRFFYLGQGHFTTINSQVLNTLNTGTNYANAVMCSISV